MITNKENYIQQAMDKIPYGLVEEFMKDYEEFMKDYCVSEYEARKALAEMYYSNEFEYYFKGIRKIK